MIVALAAILLGLLGGHAAPPPDVTARAYVLVDAATGDVLAGRDVDRLRPVASTIKVLTALTVLERAELDEVVTVGREVTVGGAGVGLRPGDTWTVEQLLQATIARSGNDAAMALAVHVGGTLEGFAALMREDAEAYGITDAVIVTPTGLDDDNRLSARHLAEVSRVALQHPEFRRIAALREVTLPRSGRVPTRNRLLFDLEGATGVKTGQTAAAGWSVIGSAERDGREVIAVVLDAAGDARRFADAAALLRYGLDAFAHVGLHAEVRLRVPGGWVDHSAAVEPVVTVPRGATVDIEVVALPSEAGSGEVVVRARLDGRELLRWSLDAPPSSAPALAGDASDIGSWLAGRAYAAMRAVTSAGEWPR